MKSSKNRSPVCTRSSISILGDSQGQADHVKEGSSAVTTTKAKESIAGRLKRKILSNITNSQFSKHAAGFLEHPTFKRKKSAGVTVTDDNSSSIDIKVNSSSNDNGTIQNPLSQRSSMSQVPKGLMQLRSSSSSSVAPSTLSSTSLSSSSSSSPQKKLQSMTLESNVLPAAVAESNTAKKKVSNSGRKKRPSSISNSPLSAAKNDKQGGRNTSAATAAKKAKADDLVITAGDEAGEPVSDEGTLSNSSKLSSSKVFTFKPIQEEDSSKSQNDREKMTSSSLSVESLKGSGSLALSVRPSPMKCMGSNSLMLASLTKTMNSREQVVQLLSASPQTAFQKASLTSSSGGNNNRNESSSNYGRSSGSSSTSTSSTFYAVSSNKCSIQSPESNPLLTPTELLPFKTAWCAIIPTVPLHITTPQKNVVNIDVVYSHLPEYAAHYSIDMYDYYNIVEDEYRPDHQYLFTQTFINAEQRAYLVNAMISISRVQYYAPSTVYLAVNVVDRYLSLTKEKVQPVELLLIGVTSLMIAFKHEESGCFRFDRMVRCVCSAEQAPRTQQQMVQLESKILKAVDFRVTLPTVHSYLNRYIRAGQLSQLAVCIARCICERSLLEYSMLNYLPSLIAASAVAMTRAIMIGTSVRLTPDSPCEQDPWTATLDYYTGYNQEDLTFCIRELQYILAIETVNRAIVYCSKALLERARSDSSSTTATDKSSLTSSSSSKRRQQSEQEEAKIRKQEEIQKYESYLPSILAFGKNRTFKIYNPAYTQHSNLGLLFNRTAAQRRDEDRISAEAATLLYLWNNRDGPDTTDTNNTTSSSSSSSSSSAAPLPVSNETLQQMHAHGRHPPIYDAVKIRFSPIYHHIVTFPPNP